MDKVAEKQRLNAEIENLKRYAEAEINKRLGQIELLDKLIQAEMAEGYAECAKDSEVTEEP